MDTKVFMPNRPMFDSGSIQGVKKAQTHTHKKIGNPCSVQWRSGTQWS